MVIVAFEGDKHFSAGQNVSLNMTKVRTAPIPVEEESVSTSLPSSSGSGVATTSLPAAKKKPAQKKAKPKKLATFEECLAEVREVVLEEAFWYSKHVNVPVEAEQFGGDGREGVGKQ